MRAGRVVQGAAGHFSPYLASHSARAISLSAEGRGELVSMSLVRDTGQRKETKSGRRATVWMVG